MACMSAETGTLVFAIINIIIVTLATAAALGFMIYTIVMISAVSKSVSLAGGDFALYSVAIPGVVFLGLMLLAWVIALVFSSLLLDGILKKKASHVKAYFIYSVLVLVMTMVAFISAVVSLHLRLNGSDFILIAIAYVVYGLILYMIRRAYVKMEAVTGLYAPKPLIVENEYC